MKDKTILIGGCSYSESHKPPNSIRPYDYSDWDDSKVWYPWTDMLDDDFGDGNNIINLARSSAGQSTIVSSLMKKLIELDFKVDLILVQWSSPARIFAEKESDILESIKGQGIDLLANKGIDVFTQEYYDELTNLGYDIAFNSFLQIYLFMNVLKSKKIKYKFFWGWSVSHTVSKYKFLFDLIYDENFILINEYGSMHGYANRHLGVENTNVSHLNNHPNTKSHLLFYNNIIKPMITKY